MEFLKESVDYFVFGILGLMGFITVWLTAERLIFLRTLDPKEYDTQDAYDKALTDHLTTLYIIYVLRHGHDREHQCGRNHDGLVTGA